MRRCPLCQPPLFSFLFFFFFFFPSARSHSFKNTRKKTWGKIGYCVTRSHKSPTARCTRNLNKCNTWHLAADHFLPCYKLSVVILYRDKSALASLQSTEKKPSSDWKRLPKRDYSRHSSPPFFSFFFREKKHPANEISGFSRRYSSWGAAGTDPTPVFGYATTGARRHPCASLPDHKFTAALPRRSAGCCHVITASFIVMRMVKSGFYISGTLVFFFFLVFLGAQILWLGKMCDSWSVTGTNQASDSIREGVNIWVTWSLNVAFRGIVEGNW